MLSAHAQVFGNFNYDCTPMDKTGIKVLLHERPEYRGSWPPHALSDQKCLCQNPQNTYKQRTQTSTEQIGQ